MQQVLEETVRLLEKGEPHVMATVVKTTGMTPQKAGAKQLIRKDGTSLGTLGGGCVEGDVWHFAMEMLREKQGPRFLDYRLDAEVAAQDGLVCGGRMFFFIEPVWNAKEQLPFAREILNATVAGPEIAVATVVTSSDENLHAGQRLLIRADGTTVGSIGEGAQQNQVYQRGRQIAPFAGNDIIEWPDSTRVYVEGAAIAPTLIIMGGGHIGRSVYTLALACGLRVVVVDDRPEFANKERFPLAAEVIVAPFDQALAGSKVGLNNFILVATRGHRYDDMATFAAINTPARYVGLLGSKRKNMLIFRELLNKGVSLEKIQQIHAPVGLDIGALTPEELAVSIVAEIIQKIRGGTGGSLKISEQELCETILQREEDSQSTKVQLNAG